MSELFSMAHPERLAWLWLLLPLALLAFLSLRARAKALDSLSLGSRRLGPQAASHHRRRLLLLLAGLALALFALAQPRYGYQWREIRQEGLDIVIVLDVSRSMDAQDVSPSRMERARREIIDLTGLARGDRLGLVLSAGGAYARVPLTEDLSALRSIVRDSDTSTLKAQGTDLGRAIEVGLELLGPPGQAQRVLLLISDGEDQVGQAEAAATLAAEQDVRIYSLGVGTPDGAPIPLPEGGFKNDPATGVVLTRLDRSTLLKLAEIGGGAYADSVPGNEDLVALYVEGIRGGGLQTAERGVRREQIWDERFAWPLALGLGLIALSAGLRAPALSLALLLCFSLPAAASSESELDRLLAEQVERPRDLDLAERVGQALFQEGDYNRAYEVLSQVAERAVDPAQKRRASSNAGLSAYRAGRLQEAVERWEQVQSTDPEHPAAKSAEAVRQEIARRLQEEPPQQDQEQDQEGEPQDQEGEPQEQQGEPQEQQGEPQEQQGEPQEQQEPQEPQEPQENDGTREPQQGEPQQPLDGELDPSSQPAGEAQDSGEGEPTEVHRPGSVSEQEANRLFDGVEEGSPRVEIDPDARKGTKDW